MIGINVNQKAFPEDIRDKATSLLLEKKQSLSRSEIAAAVMESFEGFYSRYEKTGDLSLLMEDYNKMLVNTGKEVLIMAPSGDYTGISQGIDRNGELLVQMEDGSVRKVISGEVSVRGIYGYV